MALGLRFDILGRDRASGPLNDVGDSAERTGGKLKGIGKAAAIGLGGAVLGSLGAFAAGLKGGFEEAVSYERITDQLAQTLKSTGGAANVTVDQLKKYAGQLESISGVDEELILNSQNVLATFTGIRNEVGKGNDVYNQASLAALNMSTTLGTDVAGSAVQVGKALNDPIKGITALGKAGVTFTAGQKEQIKALVKSGDTLGAQKIILAELNKEFGGAAAAAGKGFGGTMARLKDTVSDTFRDIATRALPTLTKLADGLGKHLPGIIDTAAGAFGKLSTFLAPIGRAVGQLVSGMRGLGTSSGVVGSVFNDIGLGMRALVLAFQDGDVTSNGLVGTFERMGVTLRTVFDFIRAEVLPRLATFYTVLFTQVLPAVVGFAGALAEKLGPILVQVGQFLAQHILPVFRQLWATIQTNIIPAFQGLVVRIRDNKDMFITIGKVIGTVVAVVVIVAAKLAQVLIPILGKVISVGVAVIGKVIGIQAALLRFAGTVGGVAASVGRFVGDIGAKFGQLVGIVGGLPGRISAVAGGMFNGIKDAFRSAINFIIGAWNGLEFRIPGFDPPGPGPKFGGFTLGVPDIPRLASGGIVKARQGGTLALIGEGGQDEAVIPLPRGGGASSLEMLLERILDAVQDLPRQAKLQERKS